MADWSEQLAEWGMPSVTQLYWMLALLLIGAITVLETSPRFWRSVRIMGWVGPILALLKGAATWLTIVAFALLPFSRLSMALLVALGVIGGITVVREWAWRASAGDRSPSSYLGGVLVSVQTTTFVLLVSSVAASLIEAIIAPARVLESDLRWQDAIQGWVEIVTTVAVLVAAYYCGFIALRRLLGVTGFSWMDPPNWRTLLPHLRYIIAPRLGVPPWKPSDLANIVRGAYIEHIAGSTDDAAIAAAARIRPLANPAQGFTCAILGDPGEGDDSQLRPPGEPEMMLIASDIVYPAGELMDYERTVYRPYRGGPGQPPLIYALPGNHDWYNSLKGMLLNFGYPAAHADSPDPQVQAWASALRSGPWARYGWPHQRIRYREVEALRQRYQVPYLGGDPARPESHQRLPFWELDFAPAPLTILGCDTSCTGGMDALQERWLSGRLAEAEAAGNIIVVILSEPVYVDGGMAESSRLRALYGLLRQYAIHLVMAGDTHAYQHYQVDYELGGVAHRAHHIVNGGGGAFLSAPLDLAWLTAGMLRPKALEWRFADATGAVDDHITLLDYYPTAEQMATKFSPQTTGPRLQRALARLEANLFGIGFTTALNHDRPPLYQSLVTLSLNHSAAGWCLTVTPWFTNGPDGALAAQPAFEITAPRAEPRPFV